MARFDNPLDSVKVAAPCRADWDKMVGDERVRFCQSCELNVYNLSGMSRAEAEGLIAGAESRLCVRFYRRADGTVLTNNCPVGLRAARQRVARVARAAVSATLGFLAGLGLAPAPRPYAIMGEMVYDAAPAEAELTVDVPAPPPPDVNYVPLVVPPPSERGQWEVGKMLPADFPEKVEGRRVRTRGAQR